MMKKCPRCGVEKDTDIEYGRRTRNGRVQLRAHCRQCEREYSNEWNRAHPESVALSTKRHQAKRKARRASDPEYRAMLAEKTRRWQEANPERYRRALDEARFRKTYGTTVDEAKALLARQDHKCAICERHLTWKTKRVDHIDTPRGPVVRGILCQSCNTSLGAFQESAEVLRTAARYVEFYDEMTVSA